MSYLDYVVAKKSPRSINLSASVMGALAFLRSWIVVYPSRRTGFTQSPALIAFEILKVAVLLLILGWLFVRNRSEDDRIIRSKREYAFSLAAGMSALIDIGIWFVQQS